MTSRLVIVPPSASRPFLKENLTLTPDNRTLFNALVSSLPLRGDVPPEGILKSKSIRWYVDDTTKFVYVKFLDAIDGDSSRGWSLISTEAGNVTNIPVSSDHQVVLGNKNIRATGTLNITSLLAAASEGQKITIHSVSGTVTYLSDSDIDGTATITTGQTASWFFADGTWTPK